jgi:hypothetical protein
MAAFFNPLSCLCEHLAVLGVNWMNAAKTSLADGFLCWASRRARRWRGCKMITARKNGPISVVGKARASSTPFAKAALSVRVQLQAHHRPDTNQQRQPQQDDRSAVSRLSCLLPLSRPYPLGRPSR